ncbi:CBS domain-containing protein [Scytonema sp. UIC 10036]|nr:CBS domain-containing protein [Scytonema sp. UIC 10036]
MTLPMFETAAQHLVPQVPVANPQESAGMLFTRLSGHKFDSIATIYITNEQGHLLGAVRSVDVLTMPPDQKLADAMISQLPTVHPHEDQEKVAGLAVQFNISEVPVIDSQGCFLGVVPAEALLAILRREHIEDIHRLAGIHHEDARARHALEAPPIQRVCDRIPWLLVGLAGSVLATFVVSRFEKTLESLVFVSFFVPGIVYLADAVGTQTEAIVVRGLSLNHGSFQKLVVGELWTGLFIGLCLGSLSFPLVLVVFANVQLAFAVAFTIVVAGGIAASIGLLFPWLLYRAGKDPAFGSGPVATIIQDVLSLLIYFTIVQLFVV